MRSRVSSHRHWYIWIKLIGDLAALAGCGFLFRATSAGLQPAGFLSEAVRMLLRQSESQFVGFGAKTVHRVLRNGATLVLDFDAQFVGGDDGLRELENRGELTRRQPMVRIVSSHPRLKHNRLVGPFGATAIDKVFYHVPHFR